MEDREDRECIVIVAYEVAHEDRDRFLDSWERANATLKEQRGFVSAALHQAVSANPEFRFVNIGRWENADAFRAATQHPDYLQAAARLGAFPVHASVYEVLKS
jgi:heme-degrading monooxygenase HmoA